MFIHARLLIIFGVLLASTFACFSNEASNDVPPAPPPDPMAQTRSALGQACQVDNDCPLFLRCFDSTCQDPPALNGTGDPTSSPAVSLVTANGEAQFFVEVVSTRSTRARGLMHRPRMSDGWGMLFIYPTSRHQSFWMKNTLIPLDMVFISADMKVVGVVKNATPQTEDAREIKDAISQYVLEINAGLADRYGIKAGDKVHFGRIPESLIQASQP
ncbi:MAG: DUF192 domain-containing protein [Myxococcota bacterium]